MLRSGGGGLLPPLLLVDLTLKAGDMGESDRGGLGARNGRFAASGLIRGGGARTGLGAGMLLVNVGARTRVWGGGAEWLWPRGDGVCTPLAFIWRSVNGFIMLAGCALGEGGALLQMCSPMAAISISSPQLEHLIAGRKLAGRMPSAASVVAKDIMYYGPLLDHSSSFP
jgi:hypothetical protein